MVKDSTQLLVTRLAIVTGVVVVVAVVDEGVVAGEEAEVWW